MRDAYIPADVLFNVRTDATSASEVEAMLKRRARDHPVIAPIHVRFHWATGIFKLRSDGQLAVTVIDSAPGLATRADMEKLFARLHVGDAYFTTCGRQPRGSNECGVHVVLNGWRVWHRIPLVESLEQLSLADLRAQMASISANFDPRAVAQIAARYGPAPPTYDEFLSSSPTPIENTVQQRLVPTSAPPEPQPLAREAATLRATRYVHNPYARAFDPSALSGGAPSADLEQATSEHDQCFLFSAMSAMHALRPNECAAPVSVAQLEGIQRHYGWALYQQQDAVEAAARLVSDARADIEVHETSETYSRIAGNTALISDVYGRDIAVPAGFHVVCAVGYTGNVSRVGDGLVRCARGHYICRDSVAALGPYVTPRLLGIRRIVPRPVVDPFRQRVFVGVDRPGERVARLGNERLGLPTAKYSVRADYVAALDFAVRDNPALRASADAALANYDRQRAQQQQPDRAVVAPAPAPAPAPVPAPSPAPTPIGPVLLGNIGIVRNRAREQPPPPPPPPPPPVETPPPPAPPALTRTMLRERVKALAVGAHVVAHWECGGVVTKWAGVVTQRHQPGLQCVVSWTSELCPCCGEWTAMDAMSLPLPCARTQYFALDVLRVELNCSCPHDNDEGAVEALVGEIAEAHAAPPVVSADSEPARSLRAELIPAAQPVKAAADKKSKPAPKPGAKPSPPAEVQPTRVAYAEPERAPNSRVGFAPPVLLIGGVGRRWQIFQHRPGHIPFLTWAQLATSTRMLHRRCLERIQAMPADLQYAPLGAAVVELVLRLAAERKWAWSTIASTLSAYASALNNLPLHTSEARGIDIRDDRVFAAALKRALQNGRVSLGTRISEAMPHVIFQQLCGYERAPGATKIAVPSVRLLLQLCWAFAGRVGDVRQVLPADVKFGRVSPHGHLLKLTFRAGKGAAFWGPYTIHAVVPPDVAKNVVDYCNDRPADKPMFSLLDQALLSAAVKASGFNLRSLRRGALVFNAERGVDDESLRQLSGHKRMDTLMRYLGWGQHSASATGAAEARAALVAPAPPVGAAQPPPARRSAPIRAGASDDDAFGLHRAVATDNGFVGYEHEIFGGDGFDATDAPDASVVGLFSGRNGAAGRRVQPAPPYFWMKAPPSLYLGLRLPDDVSKWPLHIKNVPVMRWDVVLQWARGTPLEPFAVRAVQWCNSTRYFGPPLADIDITAVPFARMTGDEVKQLIDGGKLVPHDGPVHGYVKGWLLPQPNKRRRRPIFEPFLNTRLDRDALIPLSYASRLERRDAARGMTLEAQFDLAAWYDQIELAPAARSYYVLRSKTPVNGRTLFALTRIPMGGVHGPGVAQIPTWLLVHELRRFESIKVHTMIDNIRILGNNPGEFVVAVREVLRRARDASMTLNDVEQWDGLSDQQLIDKCRISNGPRVFLGEQYLPDGTICNTESAVEKLRAACALLDEKLAGQGVLTYRQFAALIGLALYMAHTIGMRISSYFTLMRAYSTIFASLTEWDAQMPYVSPAVLDELRAFTGRLIANRPAPLPTIVAPSFQHDDYDAVAIVDASLSGWGARVLFPATRQTFELRQRWESGMSHSAHSEPRAALALLHWLLRNRPGDGVPRFAFITDHRAIANGQRRWWSAFGGHGRAHHINRLFDELYAASPNAEVFYVVGENNDADAASRDPHAPLTLTARPHNFVFASLRTFEHPYATYQRNYWEA